MKSPFLPPSDPLLRKRTKEVSLCEICSEENQAIIDRMFEIAQGERDNSEKKVMVGLAAPQIGINKRIILVDTGVDQNRKELGTLNAYINPEVLWYSPEVVSNREGCFSVDDHLVGIVLRSDKIRVKAYDRNGKLITMECCGFTARIFQHEIDHLNGIRFPDRVGEKGILHWVFEDEYPLYRQTWKNWQRQVAWPVWLSIKEGKPFTPPSR